MRIEKYVSRNVASEVAKIDLGCGYAKTPGFVGLDRTALPGVDIVCDLNEGIPLASDCVDYVIASHSLEHLADLPSLMSEIARVCRDRAILTITGPYSASRLNEANPYHISPFNEHTPRFWTTSPDCPAGVDSTTEDFPANPQWGLANSDNRLWAHDIRLLRGEYFYFPPYRGLAEEMKIVLRRSLMDVCDSFIFHSVILKSPAQASEIVDLAQNTDFVETAGMTFRRKIETEHGPPNAFAHLTEFANELRDLTVKVAGLEATIKKILAETSAPTERPADNNG